MRIKVRSDLHGVVVNLTVRPMDTAKDVRDAVHRAEDRSFESAARHGLRERLYFHGRELPNNRTLLEAWVEDGSTLVLAVAPRGIRGKRGRSGAVDCGIEAYGSVARGSRLARALAEAQLGFAKGIKPYLTVDGEGGTYFLSGGRKGDWVAAFKPRDEEAMAPANPKRCSDRIGSPGLRPGVLSGEAYQREVAAYLLDHDGFASVPETVMAVAFHDAFNNVAPAAARDATSREDKGGASAAALAVAGGAGDAAALSGGEGGSSVGSLDKVFFTTQDHGLIKAYRKAGSLQEFVHHDGVVSDWACERYPVREVQKIALLDLRLCNLDRNEANILVVRRPLSELTEEEQVESLSRKGPDPAMTLVPIDHGYCVPDRNNVNLDAWSWAWVDWPQVREPLDPAVREYALKLDPDADAKRLCEELAIRQECADVVRVMGHLVKRGVAAGLTLYDIAQLAIRQDVDGVRPSRLENLVVQASDLADHMLENSRVRGDTRVNRGRGRHRRVDLASDVAIVRGDVANGGDADARGRSVGGAGGAGGARKVVGFAPGAAAGDAVIEVAAGVGGPVDLDGSDVPSASGSGAGSDGSSETVPAKKRASIDRFSAGVAAPTRLDFSRAVDASSAAAFSFGAPDGGVRAGPAFSKGVGGDGDAAGGIDVPSVSSAAEREWSESSALEPEDGGITQPKLLFQTSMGAIPGRTGSMFGDWTRYDLGEGGGSDGGDEGDTDSGLDVVDGVAEVRAAGHRRALSDDSDASAPAAVAVGMSTSMSGASLSSDDSDAGVGELGAHMRGVMRVDSMPAMSGVALGRHQRSVSDDGIAIPGLTGSVARAAAPLPPLPDTIVESGAGIGSGGVAPGTSPPVPPRSARRLPASATNTPSSVRSRASLRESDLSMTSTPNSSPGGIRGPGIAPSPGSVGSAPAVASATPRGPGIPPSPPSHRSVAAAALLGRGAAGGRGSPGRMEPIGLIRVSSYSGVRRKAARGLAADFADDAAGKDTGGGRGGSGRAGAADPRRLRAVRGGHKRHGEHAALHRQYFFRYLLQLIGDTVDEVKRTGIVVRRDHRSRASLDASRHSRSRPRGGSGHSEDSSDPEPGDAEESDTSSSSDNFIGLGITGPVNWASDSDDDFGSDGEGGKASSSSGSGSRSGSGSGSGSGRASLVGSGSGDGVSSEDGSGSPRVPTATDTVTGDEVAGGRDDLIDGGMGLGLADAFAAELAEEDVPSF